MTKEPKFKRGDLVEHILFKRKFHVDYLTSGEERLILLEKAQVNWYHCSWLDYNGVMQQKYFGEDELNYFSEE